VIEASCDVMTEARSLVRCARWHCMEDPTSQTQQSLWSSVVTSPWCWSWCQQAVQCRFSWSWSAARSVG